MQWQNSHTLKSNLHDSWGKHREKLLVLKCQAQGTRATGLGSAWEGTWFGKHMRAAPWDCSALGFGRWAISTPLSSGSPSPGSHQLKVWAFPVSKPRALSLTELYQGQPALPMCQGPKGKVLCWTRLSLISPLPATLHPQQFYCPAGEDTGMVALLDIPRACWKVPHVLGWEIYRLPSFPRCWIQAENPFPLPRIGSEQKNSLLYINYLKISANNCLAKARLRAVPSFVQEAEIRWAPMMSSKVSHSVVQWKCLFATSICLTWKILDLHIFFFYFRKSILYIFSLSFCPLHPCSVTAVCSFPVAGSEILVLAQRKTNHLPPATAEV